MKNPVITCALILLSIIAFSDTTWAQSGSRSRPRASSGGGAPRGGGVSRSSGGGGTSRSGGSGTRLSAAQRSELEREQLQLQQERAKELQEQQVELAKQQRKQFLVQLGASPNGTANKQQNKLALEEAKEDYKTLRNQAVSPAQLGALNQPFRLRSDSIDRKKRTANWPKLFDAPHYQMLVTKIDSKITGNGITDSESAQEFLDELAELNQALNSAASNGEVGRTEFAKARRFITGLENEVRATNLIL